MDIETYGDPNLSVLDLTSFIAGFVSCMTTSIAGEQPTSAQSSFLTRAELPPPRISGCGPRDPVRAATGSGKDSPQGHCGYLTMLRAEKPGRWY